MSNYGNRGRGNSRRGFGRTVNQSVRFVTRRGLRTQIRGHEIAVSPIPTAIQYRPWNSLTLVFNGVSASTSIEIEYKDADVATKIAEQLGISVAGKRIFAFRLLKCRVWSEVTSSPLTSALRCRFYSIIGEGNHQIIQRFPGDVSFAAIGYQWPVEQQNVVITSANNDQLFSVFPLKANTNFVVYLDVLWKAEDLMP